MLHLDIWWRSRNPVMIAKIKRIFLIASVPAFTVFVGIGFAVQAVNPLMEPARAIIWFCVSALTVAVAVLVWEELKPPTLKGRIIVGVILEIFIFACLFRSLAWVLEKAKEAAWEKMVANAQLSEDFGTRIAYAKSLARYLPRDSASQLPPETTKPPVVQRPLPSPQVPSVRPHVSVDVVYFSPIAVGQLAYANIVVKNDGGSDIKYQEFFRIALRKVSLGNPEEQRQIENEEWNGMLSEMKPDKAPVLDLAVYHQLLMSHQIFLTFPIGAHPEYIEAVKSGREALYVMGRVTYKDSSDQSHHTDFCGFITKESIPIFACKEHDEAPF